MSFENAIFRWQEAEQRVRGAEGDLRPVLERVTARILDELRRRLGGAFTAAELAGLYDEGTDWCMGIAIAEAPDEPRAWDVETVAGAAFARYVRQALDFAGGRRLRAR